MNNRERFRAVLHHQMPDDRLPVIEWATWWDLTLERWRQEGLAPELEGDALFQSLNLDVHRQYWFGDMGPECPQPARYGAGIMEDEDDYERIRPLLYTDGCNQDLLRQMREAEPVHQAGEIVTWYTLNGGFWFPRMLFGIENHLYSFYDYPELYHRILDDLADYHVKLLEKIYEIGTPEFMTLAEDMSYNNGPMLSEEMFDEFVAPYYRRIIPIIHTHGTKVIVDSDGDVTKMVPWLEREGVDGILPLEYQAGVNLVQLRKDHPNFLMLGGFNKMIMKDGEEAMRKEFERILPVMRSGGYIPGVDHQTPPDVSLKTYHVYIRLLHEYAEKAVQGCRI